MIAIYVFFFSFYVVFPIEIYTLSLHDALPIFGSRQTQHVKNSPHGIAPAHENSFLVIVIGSSARKTREYLSSPIRGRQILASFSRSEEHTSELQSLRHLVCRLLLEKKKRNDRYLCFFFFFLCCVSHRDLHSFPTRRSSDLWLASNTAR